MAFFLLLLFNVVFRVNSYKILVVHPEVSTSDGIISNSIVRHLLESDHKVTYITSIPYEEKSSNLNQLVYKNYPELPSLTSNISRWFDGHLPSIDDIVHRGFELSHSLLKNYKVQNMMKDMSTKFDLIIAGWAYTDLIAGLGVIFQCPIIWYTTNEPDGVTMSLISPNIDYVHGDMYGGDFLPETLKEKFAVIYGKVEKSYVYNIRKDNIDTPAYYELFAPAAKSRGITLPEYRDVVKSASMMLFLTVPVIGFNQALPATAKLIGGLHLETTEAPLPEDLQDILDTHEHGVIYFSMGANIKSSTFPKPMIAELLKLFSQLKQAVFWKYEGDLSNLPSNVYIRKWFPQSSVLAHQNTRVFITHGGKTSIIESIHYGVPIIGVPMFLDQFYNVHMAISKGNGIELEMTKNLAEDLEMPIHHIVKNESYSYKAQDLSTLYHDRIRSPDTEFLYWVEHVARNGGAQHLRTPTTSITWSEQIGLDVLATMFVVVIFLGYCFWLLFKLILSL